MMPPRGGYLNRATQTPLSGRHAYPSLATVCRGDCAAIRESAMAPGSASEIAVAALATQCLAPCA